MEGGKEGPFQRSGLQNHREIVKVEITAGRTSLSDDFKILFSEWPIEYHNFEAAKEKLTLYSKCLLKFFKVLEPNEVMASLFCQETYLSHFSDYLRRYQR